LRRALFDSDVLLDVLAQRSPFIVASANSLNTIRQGQVQGFVSGHAVTTIFYILRRQLGSERAHYYLSQILSELQVASVTGEVVQSALQSSLKDFEDAVTSFAAYYAGAEVIVTRNIDDFSAAVLPAMLPDQFLGWLQD
jgi:PIN domain